MKKTQKQCELSRMSLENIEYNIHNLYKMAAVSVMDEEIEIMELKITKSRPDELFLFDEKKGRIEFRRNMLVDSIEMGVVSLEQYLHELELELVYEEKLLSILTRYNAQDEDLRRVKRRIELIRKEQNDSYEPEEAEVATETTDGNSVIEENVGRDPDEKIETRLMNLLSGKIIQYTAAVEFLEKVGAVDRAVLLRKSLDEIETCMKKCKEGQLILEKMPPNLNPEIMFGMSLLEKTEHFQKVIAALESLQEFYINISVEEKEKAVKLPKKQSKSIMIKSKSYREKANEILEILKKIRGNYEAPYQMLPLYHYSTIKQEVQVINKELSLAQMMFQYSPDTSIIGNKQQYEMQ